MTVTAVHTQARLAEVHTSVGTDSVIVLDSASVKQNFFKKFLDYFSDANKEKKNKKSDFSIIGGPRYSSDIKLGLGLVVAGLYRTDRSDTTLPPLNISLYGDVSTVGFHLLEIRGTHLFPCDECRLNYDLCFCSSPSLYWGEGYDNGVNNANESDYDRFQTQVKVDFVFRLARNLYVDPTAVSDHIYGHNIEKPELWEGMNACTTNLSLGLSLLCDSRDFLTNAYKGHYLRIDQCFNPAFLGNKYALSSMGLDTRYYHEVWKSGVLAGQLHTLLNYGNPPWGLMATLDSSYSMRGYCEGRYRGKRVTDAQIELRRRAWKRDGVAIWMGAGAVFPRFLEFDTRRILPNYGFGYR